MIPQQEYNQPVHTGGAASEQRRMGATNTATIFNFISSLIYKDPLESMVREIFANAIDSGGSKVTITCPSMLQPSLVITDNGTGMSPEMLYGGDLGSTTKSKDNTKIGGMGIGRLVPSAYASSFTFKTVHAGRFLVVELSRDNIGMLVTKRVDHPTDLPTGTTVTIPIKAADHTRVSDVVKYYAAFFKHEYPDLVIDLGRNPIASITRVNSEVSCVATGDYRIHTPSAFVTMGGVPYPVTTETWDSKALGDLRDLGFIPIIHAPIGSYEVSASREGLRFPSDSDRRALSNKIDVVADTVLKFKLSDYVKSIDDADTEWDKAKAASDVPYKFRSYIGNWVGYPKITNCLSRKLTPSGRLSSTTDNYSFTVNTDTQTTYVLCDTQDRKTNARYRTVLEKLGTYNVRILLQHDDTKDSVLDQLIDKGVPFRKLSNYQPMPPKKRTVVARGTKKVAKETLIVTLRDGVSGFTWKPDFNSEESVDLATMTNVCYYDRADTSTTTTDILKFVTKAGLQHKFTIISATQRNIKAVKAAKVPHLSDYLIKYIKDTNLLDGTDWIHAYINTNMLNDIDRGFGYLPNVSVAAYNKPIFRVGGAVEYGSWPTSVSKLFNRVKAIDLLKEYNRKLDKLKAIEYKGINLYYCISWCHLSDTDLATLLNS